MVVCETKTILNLNLTLEIHPNIFFVNFQDHAGDLLKPAVFYNPAL